MCCGEGSPGGIDSAPQDNISTNRWKGNLSDRGDVQRVVGLGGGLNLNLEKKVKWWQRAYLLFMQQGFIQRTVITQITDWRTSLNLSLCGYDLYSLTPWDGPILRSNPMFMPSFTSDLKLSNSFLPKPNLDCQHLQIKCLGIKGEVVNSKFTILKGLQMSSLSLQDESSPETDEGMKRWLKIRCFLKSNLKQISIFGARLVFEYLIGC